MILQALYRLADREGLMADSDYEWRPVAWLIRLDKKGKLLGIESTHYVPEQTHRRGKPKPVAKEYSIPRQPTGRAGTKAPTAFFVDNAKYVFGLATKDKTFPAKEGKEKSGWFREMVAECVRATGDDGAQAVLTFLKDVAADRRDVALPDECRSNDLFAFIYAPDVDRLVHRRPAIEAYWKAKRQEADASDQADRRCMVTGRAFGGAGLFPLLEDIPGASPARIGLVSFNKPAFESYGWTGNDNAPVSNGAAEACSTALKRLLDPRPRNPNGEPLSRRNFVISDDTIVCFWASDQRADSFLDQFPFLMLGDDPGKVGDLYRSVWKGKPVKLDDSGAFYALTISGTQGRAIVRDWFESSVSEVAENLAQHFKDLDIARNTPSPKGQELPPVIPLRALLGSLAPFGKSDQIPDAMATQFTHAALRGMPYPFSILQRAIERTRAEIGKSDWADLERRDARAALLKAVLNRRYRQDHVPAGFKEITAMLDPTNTNPGYLLGRLMAVLERLQQVAVNDVNASVIDRYFGSASATPKAVFTRLLKNARHHARKAKDDERTTGTARWLDGLIDEIVSAFDPSHNGFPAFLALEQQGLFVLGYHHQRHWLWLSKEERERHAA